MKMIKAILFDFDGVIVDSYDATIYYMQKTLKHFEKPIPTKHDFDNLLGLKAKDILKNFLPDIDETELNQIYEYSKTESVKAVSKIKLIHNANKVIKQLSKNYQLAIVSSRGKQTLILLLNKFDLKKYFKVIISREDVTKHKPHPQSLLKTMKALKTSSSKCVYIGDMEEDILAAKAAGVRSIFVKNKSQPDFGANFSVKTIKQIPEILNL